MTLQPSSGLGLLPKYAGKCFRGGVGIATVTGRLEKQVQRCHEGLSGLSQTKMSCPWPIFNVTLEGGKKNRLGNSWVHFPPNNGVSLTQSKAQNPKDKQKPICFLWSGASGQSNKQIKSTQCNWWGSPWHSSSSSSCISNCPQDTASTGPPPLPCLAPAQEGSPGAGCAPDFSPLHAPGLHNPVWLPSLSSLGFRGLARRWN